MSSYVEEALVAGERVIHQGRLSLWSVWHMLLLGIVLLPIGVGIAFLIIAWIRIRSTEVAVTSKRLIVKHGFVRRNTVEINLSKVESIQVDQKVIGRMLNFGTLVVSGTGTSHAPIDGIADPMAFRKAFIEAQEEGAREEPIAA